MLCWVTMLYNEEKRIEKTIKSLAPVIDAAVIGIDNKTNDKTRELVCKWLDHFQKDYEIYYFGFDENYSECRNIGIAKAELNKHEYVLVMDGDEYLDEKSVEYIQKSMVVDPSRPDFDSILSIQVGHHHTAIQQQSAPSVRIFKSKFRYIYRIHETPDIEGDRNVWMPQIIIHNDKQYEDRSEKVTKYRIKNILLDIKDYPERPELKFNLGLEYLSIGQFEQGIKSLEEALEQDLSPSMRLMAYIRKSRALHMLGRTDEEYKELKEMIKMFPHRNEHLINLTAYHLMRNEPFEAANYAFTAANIIKPQTAEMGYDHYYTWVPWYMIYNFAKLIRWREGMSKVRSLFEAQWPEQSHKDPPSQKKQQYLEI